MNEWKPVYQTYVATSTCRFISRHDLDEDADDRWDYFWSKDTAWRTKNGWAMPEDPAPGDCWEVEGRQAPVRPAMFMPRMYARILLRVRSVHQESLLGITQAEALREGVVRGESGYFEPGETKFPAPTAREAYLRLWDRINGRDAHTENPIVSVIKFEVADVIPTEPVSRGP